MSPRVTNQSAFKNSSLAIQVVLTIVTLGLYPVYWHYSTAKQLNNGTDYSINPILVTLLMFTGIGAFYTWWKTANAAEAVTDQSAVVLFVMFVLGITSPIAWFLIQSGMNSAAQ